MKSLTPHESIRNRKKAILGARSIPEPNSNKFVWVINKQGNTFIPFEQTKQTGDLQVLGLCEKEIIPKINTEMAKIWSKGQTFNSHSQLFTVPRMLIKITLVFLMLSLITIFFADKKQISHTAIIIVLLLVWMVCFMLCFYSYFQKFSNFSNDQKLISCVHSLIHQFNHQSLFSQGYALKCDPPAIWICLTAHNSSQSQINLNVEISQNASDERN